MEDTLYLADVITVDDKKLKIPLFTSENFGRRQDSKLIKLKYVNEILHSVHVSDFSLKKTW